jgi:hypothetical protein
MKIIFLSIIIIISLIILYILLTSTTFTFINKMAIMMAVILIIITIIIVYINYNMIKTGGLFQDDISGEGFSNDTPELTELKLILKRLENLNRKTQESRFSSFIGFIANIKLYPPETLDDPLLYTDDIKKILQEIDDYVEKNYNKLSDEENKKKRLLKDTESKYLSGGGHRTSVEYGIYTYAESIINDYLWQLSYDTNAKRLYNWEWNFRHPFCFQEILNKLKVFVPGTFESMGMGI